MGQRTDRHAGTGGLEMIAWRLLDRLDGVRQTGPEQWMARCPAHPDRTPSLSIREGDKFVLVHCFAGCETADIIATVGLTWADIDYRNGDRAHERHPGQFERDRVRPLDALRSVAHEALIAAIVASDIEQGREIPAADAERAALASGRIRAALAVTGVAA